jgi:hypothetical protein
LASVKANPKIWEDAGNGTIAAAFHAAYNAALHAVNDGDRETAYAAAYIAAYNAARGAAILALVAYDDSAKYLGLPLDQLKMLYALTEHPAALLLQPAVLAFAMEKELA